MGTMTPRRDHRDPQSFPVVPDHARDRPEPWEPPHKRIGFAAKLGGIGHLAARNARRAMIDRRRDAELIVAAPHGVSRLRQLLMGSRPTGWC